MHSLQLQPNRTVVWKFSGRISRFMNDLTRGSSGSYPAFATEGSKPPCAAASAGRRRLLLHHRVRCHRASSKLLYNLLLPLSPSLSLSIFPSIQSLLRSDAAAPPPYTRVQTVLSSAGRTAGWSTHARAFSCAASLAGRTLATLLDGEVSMMN